MSSSTRTAVEAEVVALFRDSFKARAFRHSFRVNAVVTQHERVCPAADNKFKRNLIKY
jgi:hypothetical protein